MFATANASDTAYQTVLSRVRSALHEKLLKATDGKIERGLEFLKELGPYAAIEILLPGGTLIALLVWLYRRHKGTNAHARLLSWIRVRVFAVRLPAVSAS